MPGPDIMVMPVPDYMKADDYQWLLLQVSEEKRDRASRFCRIQDAYRTLLGEALIRAAAISRLGLHNEQIKFACNAYGKPSLPGIPDFQFNVSHSGRWIVAFVSNVPVGIDVEELHPLDLKVAEFCLTSQEYADLLSRDEGEQAACFYEYWTLKESYIKARGEGLSIPLQSFSVIDHATKSICIDPDGEDYYFRQYELDSSCKLAACSVEDRFPESLTTISFGSLRKQLSLTDR